MSSCLTVLLMASYIFPIHKEGGNKFMKKDAFKLLQLLKELVVLTYWWPDPKIDGRKNVVDILKDNCFLYYATLQRKSKNYITMVNNFCKVHKKVGRELDKPNLH